MSKRESLVQEHARLQAPFFCKIRFYAPTKLNQKKNIAHLNYIGQRSGVVVKQEEIDFSRGKDEMVVQPGTAAGHVKYVDERPGSHGLFSSDHTALNIKSIQHELGQHEGVVWRMILSLTEEDAKRLEFDSRKSWEDTLRAKVPEAAASMGIGETNLRWVAAFHEERGHPHVHLVLWEKNPERRRGKLSEAERKEVRKSFMDGIYASERIQLHQEKTAMRDYIRDLSKDQLVEAVDVLREITKLENEVNRQMESIGAAKGSMAPKLYPEDQLAIASRMQEIASQLPSQGRIAYKFMPKEVKDTVNKTTQWFLSQPAFYESKNRYLAAVETMTKHYTFNSDQINKAKDKAVKDLEKRVSQIVLKAAAESKKTSNMIVNVEKADIVIGRLQIASMKHVDHFAKNVMTNVIRNFAKVLYASGKQSDEVKAIITSWNQRSGLHVEDSRLSKEVNTVEKQVMELRNWGRDVMMSKKDFEQFTKSVGIQAPYMWDYKGKHQEPTPFIAKDLWKSMWNAMEQERMRVEAEGYMLKRQQERQTQQAAKQNREQDDK